MVRCLTRNAGVPNGVLSGTQSPRGAAGSALVSVAMGSRWCWCWYWWLWGVGGGEEETVSNATPP